MSIVIILGDVHIGKSTSIGKAGIGSALNSRIADQMELLDWTREQAILQHASKIIITGDVFEDPKPPPYLITLFISWIKRCELDGIEIEIVMGNHDILRNGKHYISPLDIITESELPNCTVYKDIATIAVGTTYFTFLPFRDRKSFATDVNADALSILKNMLMYEVSSIPLPYTKVLVGHLALEGSIYVGDEIDDMMNELFCTFDMFEGYDYVWMGHVHKPQIMQKKPFIAHIGSMDTSNFGESDHKKHIVVFDTENANFTQVELPTRGLAKIAISIPKDTPDTTQFVIDELKAKKIDLNRSIVRLEVSLADSALKPVNRNDIEKYLLKEGVFNISGFSETKKISLVKKDKDTGAEINITTDVAAAIKLWADKKWTEKSDEDRKNKFIEASLAIVNDFKAGAKS